MKLTNKLNLPQSFVNYANGDGKEHEFNPNKYSVTEILGSPKEIYLARKYREEITNDVCDLIPALFGTAVHSILEKNSPEDIETEVKVEAQIDSKLLVGRIDLLDKKNKLIGDYKTCSVSKIMNQDFEDWKLQGLIYAWICYFYYGVDIRKLEFYGLMKDWSKLKSNMSANYPKSPIYIWKMDIQDSDYDFIGKWIRDKLDVITNYDGSECTDEEMWYTGTKFAVYKNQGDERAKYIADSLEDATNYNNAKLEGQGYIVERKGDYLKCMFYCDVKEFCERWKQ